MSLIDEIKKALNEAESEDSTVEQVEYLYAHAPEWLRLLVERVREYERLEETVMAFLDLQHNMAPYGHMIDEMYKDIAALAKEHPDAKPLRRHLLPLRQARPSWRWSF